MAHTMLNEFNTPLRFWADAINTACYAANRLYLHKFFKKTSYELLTGKKPDVSHFRVFGAKCIIYGKRKSTKLAPEAHNGFFLGYVSDSRNYQVFNNVTWCVEETIDVEFEESDSSHEEHLLNVVDI